MGSTMGLQWPDARAAGEIKNLTQTLEATTATVLINQKQQSVLNPVPFHYHSVATSVNRHLIFKLRQRLTNIMESAFQLNQFWEHAQYKADLKATDVTSDEYRCTSFTVKTKT